MAHNEPGVTAGTEGSLREQLAAYFLAAPPLAQQTPAQRLEYNARLQQLGQLESREILQAAGVGRPMVWGNPVPLLQGLFAAAQRLAAGVGQPLLLFPANGAAIEFHTLLHPRILSLGATHLLRAACLAAPRQPVWVRLQEQHQCLTVSVSSPVAAEDYPSHARQALEVTKECARLHGGSLAQCNNTIGFSCGRVEEPPADTRPYLCPGAEELLKDTLSAVWTGFYCWLSPSSETEANPSSAEAEAGSDKV